MESPKEGKESNLANSARGQGEVEEEPIRGAGRSLPSGCGEKMYSQNDAVFGNDGLLLLSSLTHVLHCYSD